MKKFWSDNSLSITMLGLFAVFWAAMSVVGWHEYNDELGQMKRPELSYPAYLGSGAFWSATFENWESEFLWFESFQNWQSEFLAVAAIVILSIRLRQKGSPESKPVHAPHSKTGAQ